MDSRTTLPPLHPVDKQVHFPPVHCSLDLRSTIFKPRGQAIGLLHPREGWMDQDALGYRRRSLSER